MTDLLRPDTHDFDAWRAQQRAARRTETVRIFGQDIPVPTGISLDLSMRIEEADLDDVTAITELVAEMYGADELARWRKEGCTTEEFAVLLAWGSSRANGEQVTFEEAVQIVARRRDEPDEPEGKANRAQRRASKKRKR